MNFGQQIQSLRLYHGCTHVNNIEVVELVKKKDIQKGIHQEVYIKIEAKYACHLYFSQ
jgi:hypothetical protein